MLLNNSFLFYNLKFIVQPFKGDSNNYASISIDSISFIFDKCDPILLTTTTSSSSTSTSTKTSTTISTSTSITTTSSASLTTTTTTTKTTTSTSTSTISSSSSSTSSTTEIKKTTSNQFETNSTTATEPIFMTTTANEETSDTVLIAVLSSVAVLIALILISGILYFKLKIKNKKSKISIIEYDRENIKISNKNKWLEFPKKDKFSNKKCYNFKKMIFLIYIIYVGFIFSLEF